MPKEAPGLEALQATKIRSRNFIVKVFSVKETLGALGLVAWQPFWQCQGF